MANTIEFLNLPVIVSKENPIDIHLLNIVETCQFAIVCFTFPFYVFIICYLLEAQSRRIEELSTPFFKLCVSTSIIDLWTLLNNYFGAMFPKWGWGIPIYLYLDKFYTHTYFYFAWSTGVCQVFSVSLLASNRLSAILHPNEHRSIWGSKKIRYAYALQYLPGVLMGLFTLLNDAQLFRNIYGGIVPKFTIEYLTDIFFAMAGVLLLIATVYIICSYCYLFYFLRKNTILMRKTGLHSIRMNVKKREFKLFAMSSVVVVTQIAVLCLLTIFLTSIFVLSVDEFYLLFNALTDLNSGINPYLLWIFSDSLRTYILRRIGLKKPKKKPMASAASMVTVM